tara:strand:+ start:107 stop:250 length:144 start_codon:yes stop_codon:yes gene_type:complete
LYKIKNHPSKETEVTPAHQKEGKGGNNNNMKFQIPKITHTKSKKKKI